MSKHTPGPWVVSTGPQTGKARAVVGPEYEGVVNWRGISHGAGRGDANAHLIAAAPELLDALIAAQAKLFALGREFASPRFTDRHGDGPAMLAIAERARAAIAKATNEQIRHDGGKEV